MKFPEHKPDAQGCTGRCCLQVQQLGVVIDEQVILQDISFHLHCGEIVALIGPNGAGKSSLFQSILGQLPHTGEIYFARAGGKPMRPLIGYVPQSPSFEPGDPISVLDFFTAATTRYPTFLPIRQKQRARVRDSLQRVQGEALLDKRLAKLSGGELQRVLLALALEPLPQILILDEPLSGVDVEGEHQLFALLLDIRERYDLSILFSTHDFESLSRYADRVILLQQSIRTIGTAQQVMDSKEFADAFHLKDKHEGGWSL